MPGRQSLDAALESLDRPWDGGPLSEAARRQLAGHAEDVAAFTIRLRSPHQQNPDTEHALSALRRTLTGQEPIPYGDGSAWAAPA